MKVCSKCNEEKPFSEFYKHKLQKGGIRTECKTCTKKYNEANKERRKQYLEANRERIKQYREANKEKKKQYYEDNKKIILERIKQYSEDNKERITEYKKQYYQKNKERIDNINKEYRKQWCETNKETIAEKRRKYIKQRKQTDSIFKFKCAVRYNIKGAFKRGTKKFRKNTKTEQILGCTIEEFRLYIQSKFKKGMSFDNHGEWHLDHIIPLAVATTEEEIIRLNHYTNFQPLWAEDNLKKGNKIIN